MHRRTGFTLVELSIVLVIIGLLIGGLLVAQSLISAAKFQKQIKQLQQYEIATTNFKGQFNCLPGEMLSLHDDANDESAGFNNFPTTCDLVLKDGVGGTGLWYEGTRFFSDLSKTGHIKEQYAFLYARNLPGAGEGHPFPIPAISGKRTHQGGYSYISVIEAASSSDGQLYWLIDSQYYNQRIDWWAAGTLPPDGGAPLYTTEALALDLKLDDGHPFTGGIRTVVTPAWGTPTWATGFPFPVSLAEGGGCDDGSGNYNTSLNDVPRCGLQIKANVY